MFYALFVCGHYFFNASLSKSAFSTYYFGDLAFWLSVFYVFFRVMSFEFDCHIYRITTYSHCFC